MVRGGLNTIRMVAIVPSSVGGIMYEDIKKSIVIVDEENLPLGRISFIQHDTR